MRKLEDFTVGEQITVKGKTNRGKNRIHEHGSLFTIHRIVHKLWLNSNADWILVKPPSNKWWCWVHINDDNDFEIVD